METKTRIWKSFRQFCLEEDGPTAVEYAVIIALILAVCMASVGTLATSLRENFDKSADALTKAGP